MKNDKELLEITEKYSTPMYLFDLSILKDRYFQIKEIVGKNISICYAIKSNPFLVKFLKDDVDSLEVCSFGELNICMAEQVELNKIVLSGVYKKENDIDFIMQNNKRTGWYTIESINQLKMLVKKVENEKNPIPILIRMTSGNQFGINREEIIQIIKNKEFFKNVLIQGIQFYSGTQKRIEKIKQEIEELKEICSFIKTELNYKLDIVEYGPGLNYNYFQTSCENDYEDLKELVYELKRNNFYKEYNIVLEIGRYLTASCGMYLTKVVDMKINDGINYAIVDGGINHIKYHGQILGIKNPRVKHINNLESQVDKSESFVVCGSLCTVNDILLKNYEFSNLQIGDILVFYDAGAYAPTEGIALFLSRDLPTIAVKMYNGKILKIRESGAIWKLNTESVSTKRL